MRMITKKCVNLKGKGRCRYGEGCRFRYNNKEKNEDDRRRERGNVKEQETDKGRHDRERNENDKGKEEEPLLAFMGEKIKEEMEKLRKEISVQKNGNGYDAHWQRNFWLSNQYQNHQPG